VKHALLAGKVKKLSRVTVQKQTLTPDTKGKMFRKASSTTEFCGLFALFSVLLRWLVLECCTVGTKLIF